MAIKTASVVDAIVSTLKQDIITGKYEQGSRMRESELAERFGVSRTPMREAFRILQSEGLLEHIPNSGMIVSGQLDETDVAERMHVMGVLSAEASYLAATVATKEQKAGLLALYNSYHEREFDADQSYYWDMEFHCMVADLSGNRYLANSVRTVIGTFEHQTYALKFRRERYYQSMAEHGDILQAILNGEADLARISTQVHFSRSVVSNRNKVRDYYKKLQMESRLQGE